MRVTFELSEFGAGVTKLRVLHELENAPQTLVMVTSSAPEMGGGWSWISTTSSRSSRPARRSQADADYAVAVIVMPPRAFCVSVTVTAAGPSSSAAATSSLICTARASPNAPSFRKRAR